MKIAGAPISWGVCEVPGWGYQLAPDRVLAEMREAGLTATELGPEGFLPTDTDALADAADGYDLACVGGFVPVVLYKDDHDPAPDDLAGPPGSLVAAGAGVVVLAAATGADGYDDRPVLDENQWATLLANLDRLAEVAASAASARCCTRTSERWWRTRAEVDRVLAGSRIPLCLDTGHLLIGGTDPLALTRQAPDRIAHAHLKDVDAALAAKVQSGRADLHRGRRAPACTPAGRGDVDIAGIVETLGTTATTAGTSWSRTTSSTASPKAGSVGRRAGQRGVPAGRGAGRVVVTLRIGVLGASRIAELAIVGPAQDLGHRLVAVAARDPHRAALFAEKYGVERVLGSYEDVLEDPEVDIVYNPLANSLHGPWSIAAVRAGKPVLAEKPYARNADEAREVAAAAQAAGVPVVEAFHYRYHPVTCRLLELIALGDLGELRHVEVDMGMPAPGDDDPRWQLELGGGALMDLGCYGLHVLRTVGKILGAAPEVVAARAVERVPGVDARCDVDLRIGDLTARSNHSMVDDEYHFTISVQGSRGEALVHNFVKPQEDDRLTIRTLAGDRVERFGTRASYTYQLEAVAAHLVDGTPLPVDDVDAIENMTLIDAAYRAAGLEPR